MSAAKALAFEDRPRRVFFRHPINVPLDLIALRSGVPENLPGRCTDISETGVGAVVAGELAAGQQIAVELRLPNVGVPVKVRALVRYQSRLRCGFVARSAPGNAADMMPLGLGVRELCCVISDNRRASRRGCGFPWSWGLSREHRSHDSDDGALGAAESERAFLVFHAGDACSRSRS